MYNIWLISMALDASFIAKLRKALAKFGDGVSVKAAPLKGRARMQNKLDDPDDHALKKRPRPMHNIDTVRAAVVLEDASIMKEVFDAIGAEVGPWLRVKNNYRAEFDSNENHGYRALLGNLKFASGLTCKEVFGGENTDTWEALRLSMDSTSDRARVSFALQSLVDEDKGCRDLECKIAAEVQIIYKPYLTLGRLKSSLYYKIVRCSAAAELVRDVASKYEKAAGYHDAEEACRRVVMRRAAAGGHGDGG